MSEHPNKYIKTNEKKILQEIELIFSLNRFKDEDLLDIVIKIAESGLEFKHLKELWKEIEKYAKEKRFGIIVPYVPVKYFGTIMLEPAPYLILVLKEGSKYRDLLWRLKKRGLIFIEEFNGDLKLYYVGPKWLLDKFKEIKRAKVPLLFVREKAKPTLRIWGRGKTRIATDFYKKIIGEIHAKLVVGDEDGAISLFAKKLLKVWALDKKEQKLLNIVVKILKVAKDSLEKLDPGETNLRIIRDKMGESCKKIEKIIEDDFIKFLENLSIFYNIFEAFAYLYDAIWNKAKNPKEDVSYYLEKAKEKFDAILKNNALKNINLYNDIREIKGRIETFLRSLKKKKSK